MLRSTAGIQQEAAGLLASMESERASLSSLHAQLQVLQDNSSRLSQQVVDEQVAHANLMGQLEQHRCVGHVCK